MDQPEKHRDDHAGISEDESRTERIAGSREDSPAPGENMRELLHATGMDRQPPFDEGFATPVPGNGVDAMDRSEFPTARGGETGATGQVLPSDSSGIYAEGSTVTAEGDLAIDGGHLAGTKDNFEGELQSEVVAEPGAGDRANEGLSKK